MAISILEEIKCKTCYKKLIREHIPEELWEKWTCPEHGEQISGVTMPSE